VGQLEWFVLGHLGGVDQQVVQALVGGVEVVHLALDDRSCRVCPLPPGGSSRRPDWASHWLV
jgi:hypothetical protein